jgi:opacity protein-like surface antigen
MERSAPRGRDCAAARCGAIVVVLLILAGERAPAEMSHWGGHLAYTKARDASDGNYLWGGHLELSLAPVFGLQGSVDYRSEDKFITPGGGNGVRVRSIPVTLSGRFYLPGPLPIRPFAEAGAGWYRVVYDYTSGLEALGLEDDTVSSFGWHAGLGANLSLAPNIILTTNGRYIFVDPKRELDRGVREQIRDLDYDSINLGIGLSVGF